jgi:hypothetical protein
VRAQRNLPGFAPPPRGRGPFCGYCRQPIRYLRVEGGKRVPVDRNPSPTRGRIRLEGGIGQILGTMEARIQRDRGIPLFVPHYESCVQSKPFIFDRPSRPVAGPVTSPDQGVLELPAAVEETVDA